MLVYLYLDFSVILKGPMLGFIFQHHGTYGDGDDDHNMIAGDVFRIFAGFFLSMKHVWCLILIALDCECVFIIRSYSGDDLKPLNPFFWADEHPLF